MACTARVPDLAQRVRSRRYCALLMFVLIVGSGRVGSAVAKSMLADGHEVSVLDENSEAIALLNRGQDQSWEDLGGSFTVGTALEIDALLEAGIDRSEEHTSELQ